MVILFLSWWRYRALKQKDPDTKITFKMYLTSQAGAKNWINALRFNFKGK